MIKEMEKALKRYLKGKNRITMGVVVAFLLGSSFAFGDVTVKYDTAISTLIVQDDLGNDKGTVTKTSANEFTWTLPEGVDISETVKIDDTVNANSIKVNIVNNGNISGSSTGGNKSGNGICSYSQDGTSTIGNIINNGSISGSTTGNGDYSGNGILSHSVNGVSLIGNITNYGTINGSISGIFSSSKNRATIGDVVNYGTINGPIYGICAYSSGNVTIGNITNNGIISSIVGAGTTGTIGKIINRGNIADDGILSQIIDGMSTIKLISNTGLITGTMDGISSYSSSGLSTIESISNSGVIMGSECGIYINGDSGSGINDYDNYGLVIGQMPVLVKDGSGSNTFTVPEGQGMAVTHDGSGDITSIALGTGDPLTRDTLNFGSAVTKGAGSDNINLFHKISNVENININQKVTAFETSEITGADKINIGKNGELVLRIDGTANNNHALSGNTIQGNIGTIDSEGGKLLLALNGVSDGSTIDMGMNLGDGIYGVEKTDIKDSDLTLGTTSYLHSIRKNPGSSTITVETKYVLPTTPEYTNYYRLNKIYQSMRAVDGIKEFNADTNEKFSSFMEYLNDIYAGNPYSYSSELSRKSMGMFRDIVTENSFKADIGKWMIYGGLTHIDGGTKDTYYGKGYYTYDIGSSDIDSDTKITGAYMLGEYGVSDDFKAGVAVGGNKLKFDLSNGSKVDGSAMYLGAYAKKYLGNLKVTAGVGFQYGDYDTDRMAVNKVAFNETKAVMKYSDSYNDMTYDIYLNGRYSHNIGNNLFLEPYATLSYTYVDQDGADEGNKTLAIKTDSKSFDYTVGKMGVDLKKVIPHEKGKSTLSAGVSYIKILDGADEEYITGTFKGKLLNGKSAKNFDILVAYKNEHSIGLNAKYALELENGVIFDVKGTYSIERDSHNGSGKNRTKGEWIIGAGLGYKF